MNEKECACTIAIPFAAECKRLRVELARVTLEAVAADLHAKSNHAKLKRMGEAMEQLKTDLARAIALTQRKKST